jgi:hypothetical protein
VTRPSPQQLIDLWKLTTMPTENVRFVQSYVDDEIGPDGKPLCSAMIARRPPVTVICRWSYGGELACHVSMRTVFAWPSERAIVPVPTRTAAARSKQVGDEEMSSDIRWIRSYVVHEHDGGLGTVCIYQASSPEKIREHASRADLPATEIFEIADTVIVRPDPAAVTA